jgi:hypothetical protein
LTDAIARPTTIPAANPSRTEKPQVEIASPDKTCGWIDPGDLYLAPDYSVQILCSYYRPVPDLGEDRGAGARGNERQCDRGQQVDWKVILSTPAVFGSRGVGKVCPTVFPPTYW